jgi:hypothetical protein
MTATRCPRDNSDAGGLRSACRHEILRPHPGGQHREKWHAWSVNCTPAGMLNQHRARSRPRVHGVRAPLVLALVLALMGLHLSVGAAWADELIVDDADAAVQLTGTWEASATTPGFYGGGYLFHAPGHGTASVRWPFPADGAPGRYQVFVRWSSGPNRASAAVYRIVDSAGTAHVQVNQQLAGGWWHALGTFSFQPGPAQGVMLSGNADGVVVADAVVWVGPLGTGAGVGLDDLTAAQPLQRAADVGDQPWRLDPVDVARADATVLGFGQSDPMELVEEKTGYARVRAQHAGTTYDIRVTQPARLGPTGVWVVESVRSVGSASHVP